MVAAPMGWQWLWAGGEALTAWPCKGQGIPTNHSAGDNIGSFALIKVI